MFQLFMRLKHERPKFHHKISAVAGDVSLPGLGLSATDRQTLADEVNIVFHAAATIRFDEHIRIAVNINVLGTREIIRLAKEMTNLKVTRLLPPRVIDHNVSGQHIGGGRSGRRSTREEEEEVTEKPTDRCSRVEEEERNYYKNSKRITSFVRTGRTEHDIKLFKGFCVETSVNNKD